MKKVSVAVILGLTFALASCGTINSNLGIPPGEEFRLGENQHGAFTVSASNTGAVPVRIIAEGPGGTRSERAVLEPGAASEAAFAAGSTAVFANDSTSDALVKVRIVGDTNLSMGYAPSQ